MNAVNGEDRSEQCGIAATGFPRHTSSRMQNMASIMKIASTHLAFVARAMASRDEAKSSGDDFTSAEVHGELDCMLAEAETESRSLQHDTHH